MSSEPSADDHLQRLIQGRASPGQTDGFLCCMPREGRAWTLKKMNFRSVPHWGVGWTVWAGAVVHLCAAASARGLGYGLRSCSGMPNTLRACFHVVDANAQASVLCSKRTTAVRVLTPRWLGADHARRRHRGCYLVDPASSHMLVSKIKPCMCKYELIQTVKLRMAH